MTNAPHHDRLKQLLAKAEKGSVWRSSHGGNAFVTLFVPVLGPRYFKRDIEDEVCAATHCITPAQFAQLKTEFPDKWRE